MNKKILNFIKKRKVTKIARYLPIKGESWFNTYFLALKSAFRRAWNWKFMWFWAIFIGGSGSLNFNGSGGFNDISDDINASSEFSTDPVLFFMDNIIWFISGIIIILFTCLIFWIISCVSRWGLIKSISEIQNIGKPKNDKIMEVWKKGEEGLGRIFLFDVMLILFWISIVGGIVIFVIGVSYSLSQFIVPSSGWIFLFLSILPFIFVIIAFSVMIRYIVSIATVIMVLEDSRPIKSIKKALHLMRYGYREVVKLLLIRMLLGFINVGFAFTFFTILLLVGIFIATPFIAIVMMQGNIFENSIFSVVIGGIGIIYLVFFIISLIVFLIILKLVDLDLWTWWVKRNISSLRETKDI